jgi:hypothetical protein
MIQFDLSKRSITARETMANIEVLSEVDPENETVG